MEHLFVTLVIVERDYRDAVVDVEGERVNTVVNYYDVADLVLLRLENAQIFDIIALWS